jgi:hypothetical protein
MQSPADIAIPRAAIDRNLCATAVDLNPSLEASQRDLLPSGIRDVVE